MEEERIEFSIRLDDLFHSRKKEIKKYEVAQKLCCDRVTLSYYTCGKKCPSVARFMEIANVLNATDKEIIHILNAFRKPL